MATAAAELFVRVSADLKGLTSGMEKAAQAVDNLGKEAQQAASPLGNLRTIIAGTAAGELLADGIKSAAQAMVGLGAQSIKLANELEQNKVAFTTMLGSAEKADAFLRDLSSFAANTPFELRGLTDSSKKLLAFGFDAQSILPIMNSVGNAVAGVGGGKEVLDGVTLALGQMAAKGKVSAEEMNQLAERGIPAWQMLAKEIGVSQPQAMKMAEKGAIDANTAIVALVNGMNKQFPDMMKKQAATLGGALSNLQDSADQALTRIGESLKKNLSLAPLVQTISLAINNLTAAFTSGGLIAAFDMAFGPTTKAAIVGIASAVTAVLIPSIVKGAMSLATMGLAAAPVIAAAAAIAFAAYPIIKNWDELRLSFGDAFKYMSDTIVRWYNATVVPAVENFTGLFRDAVMYVGDMFRSVLGDEIANKLSIGLGKVAGKFSGLTKMATVDFKVLGMSLSDIGSTAAANWQETWGGAMSASQGFTAGLFDQIQGQALKIPGTLTKAMTGLKSVAASSDDAAKAQAKAAKEAERLRREFERQYAAAQKSYEKFENIADAMSAVSRAVSEVEAKHQELGRSYDVAGEKAEAMRGKLGGVESALGKQSVQAQNLRVKIYELEQASKNGGAAMASAFKVLDGAAVSIEQATLKAKLLGEEFDANDAAVQQYSQAVKDLIAQGLKPGNEQLDEAIKRYNAASEAKKKAADAAKTLAERLDEVTSMSRSVFNALKDMGEVFGLKLPDGIAKVVDGVFTLLNGFSTLMTVGPKLVEAILPALTTIGAAAAANPIGAVVVGVTAAVVAGIAAWNWYKSSSEEAMRAASAAAKLAAEELQANNDAALASSDLASRLRQKQMQAEYQQVTEMVGALSTATSSAVRSATLAFMSGSKTWATDLRESLKKAMFESLLDKEIFDQLGTSLKGKWQEVGNLLRTGNKEAAAALAKNIAEDAEAMIGPITEGAEMLMKAFGMAPSEVTRLAKQAQSSMQQASGLAQRNKETLNYYAANIEKDLSKAYEKNMHLAAPGTAQRDLFERLKTESNRTRSGYYNTGMATGGLVTGPVLARMGEGGRNEAVLPLNENVYRQIGQGIAAAQGGGMGTQVVVQYYGNGKWTREDAQGLGRLLVSELRAMGVRA